MDPKNTSAQVQLFLDSYNECLGKWTNYEEGRLKTQLENIAQLLEEIQREEQAIC